MGGGSAKTLVITFILALLALAGCGSMGGQNSQNDGTGDLRVALTDAPGDFTAYDVKVVEVTLTRANGAEVSTLPVNARVDFSELTQTTELVTTGALPLGEYTGVSLTLDYTDAQVFVEKEGVPVKAVTVDSSGAPLGVVKMKVNLTGSGRFTVNRGCVKDITLDFNLAATNAVDLTPAVPVVTVTPFLVAEIDTASHKTLAVRGPLVSTDAGGTFFTMGVKPRMASRDMGRIKVDVDELTEYLVDGQAAKGAAGFALLAAKGVGTAVVAEGQTKPGPTSSPRGGMMDNGTTGGMNGSSMGGGSMNGNGGGGQNATSLEKRTFAAARVRAGSSVQGGELDALKGTVAGRVGNTLTISGAVVDHAEKAIFGATITATVGDLTRVTREGDEAADLTAQEISVGQKVALLGVYNPLTTSLDASSGSVRLLVTRAAGVVNAVTDPTADKGGEINLTLAKLGGSKLTELSFAGTGKTTAEDANPVAYVLATGPLTLDALLPGDPLVALGFPTAFGTAHPDFRAVTLMDLSAVEAELHLDWMMGTASPITTLTATSLTLSTSGAGMMSEVEFGGAPLQLPVEETITVSPAADGKGTFALISGRNVTTFADFSLFAQALDAALKAGAKPAMFYGRGSYAPATLSFTAETLSVRLRQ